MCQGLWESKEVKEVGDELYEGDGLASIFGFAEEGAKEQNESNIGEYESKV